MYAIVLQFTMHDSLDFENVCADHSDDDGGRGRGGLQEHRRQHADHYPHYRVLEEKEEC